VFTGAGYEAVAPAIIQPAEAFLDVVGEELRARTYVFTDPEGAELCLRPDLTVPTCRLHLARNGREGTPARYCYNGPAFRFQPGGDDGAHPREFRQAGIEFFGEADREKAEAEILGLILTALRATGLERWRIRIGDLGLFNALLDSLALPERWRQRLRSQFWRPEAFHAELARLASSPAQALHELPPELVRDLAARDAEHATALLGRYFEAHGIEPVGVRTVEEIAEGLLAAFEDARAEPIPGDTAELIERYLGVRAPARGARTRIEEIIGPAGISMSAPLAAYARRLDLLAAAGADIGEVEFSAEFGRNLEYYTGFVFELVAAGAGARSWIAGGGRYDGLMKAVGAPSDVPAVGAAVHTERLLSLVEGAMP
jgi:ATP phosphoribosyltransferase regulatory subunit